MAIIRLVEKVVDFRTELGGVIVVSRTYAETEFIDKDGNDFQRAAIVDSAAPLSVLPYTLWHDKNLSWQLLGKQLTRGADSAASALTWLGIPCHLGEAQIRLVDTSTQVRSTMLRIRAKFPLARVANPMEKELILGQSFLIENGITCTIRGGAGKLDGVFLVD